VASSIGAFTFKCHQTDTKLSNVDGISGVITSLPICEGCTFEKHQASNFPSKSNLWSKKLV
jgi:hypothetical protein